MLAAGRGESDAVCGDGVVHRDGLDGVLHGEQASGVGDPVERDLLALPGDPVPQDVQLLRLGGVPERDAHQEPVQLRLGKGVGPFVLNGIRGGEHVEGAGQREGLALDRDLALLHRLEQRRLGLGWGSVDLVGEQQAGEQGTAPERELLLALVVDERPGEVRRQEVRRELRTGELQPEGGREGPGRKRLAETREVLDEDVSARQDRAEDEGERLSLPDDGALDLVEDALALLGDVRERHTHGDSILSRSADRYWASARRRSGGRVTRSARSDGRAS